MMMLPGERIYWISDIVPMEKGTFHHTQEHKEKMSCLMKQRKHSLATRQKLSEIKINAGAWSGEKNPNWKGGIHSSNCMARHNGDYIRWRRNVLKEYGNQCGICKRNLTGICQCCGQKIMKFVHHKKPFNDFPELRYVIENGIVLCQACHGTIEKSANSAKPRTGNAEPSKGEIPGRV